MNTLESLPKSEEKVIPKVVIQTVKNMKSIPRKVYDNIKQYCQGYQHLIFTDTQCINFIKKFYSEKMSDVFIKIKSGPHRADLFRYCYLYKFGGVYLDIKTHLISNIDTIFSDDYLYTVIGVNRKCIYQGVIACPPNHPIFKTLIDYIIKNHHLVYRNYLIFCNHFFRVLNNPKPGLNKYGDHDIYLFMERATREKPKHLLDKYGLYSGIFNNDKLIIKTRYPEYR